MTNVIEHQTTIWKRLKENVDAVEHHLQQARSLWPDIAKDMVELRDQYSDNISFGKALVEHGIEFNADNRAAYIWMGRLTREQLEDAMDNCPRTSPKHFRETVQGWNDPYYAPKVFIDTVDNDPVVPEPTPDPAPEPVSTGKPKTKKPRSGATTSKKDDDNTIKEHYTGKLPPGGILKMVPPRYRAGLAQAIRDGKLGESNPINFTGKGLPTKFSLRWLLYAYPRWEPNMKKSKHAVLDNLDKFLDHIERCNGDFSIINVREVWHEMHKPAAPSDDGLNTAPTGPDLSGFSAAPDPKYQEIPNHEADIIVHGVKIWPTSTGSYTYHQAWAAYQFWKAEDDMLKLGEPNAANRGRHFMSHAAWLEHASFSFSKVFHKIATAQFSNPDTPVCMAAHPRPRMC